MIKPALLLAATLLALPAQAQVYKCRIGDATLYQETPCPGASAPLDGGGLTIHEAPDYSGFPDLRRDDARPARRPASSPSHFQSSLTQRNARVRAHARGEIIPGMTKGQVIAMLGEPDYRRRYRRSTGVTCEVLTWHDPRFVEYDHYRANLCDGIVVD
ncbi:hypothetical protein [Halomonas koreensis]|uniref:DUF4124 domain-containing protein n=1 Tax=Halomonas koreensis TaxID=245385 RepID=A0ABU1G5U2_9GAMM|nr:hypothetical protein [Halomonas koreensis]MDR5868296.1 hypothetical protein [Halomonas koreensis]